MGEDLQAAYPAKGAMYHPIGGGIMWRGESYYPAAYARQITDAMVEKGAEAIWREQWARAVSEGRRESVLAWRSASRRTRAEFLLDARAAITAALGGDKQ